SSVGARGMQRHYAHCRVALDSITGSQQQLELGAEEELRVGTGQLAQADLVAGGAVGEIAGVDGELGGVTLNVIVHAEGDLVEGVFGSAAGEGDAAVDLDQVVAREGLPAVVEHFVALDLDAPVVIVAGGSGDESADVGG